VTKACRIALPARRVCIARSAALIALALCAGPALSSAASAAEFCQNAICVSDVWARATPGNAQTGAIFLTVSNRGAAPDSITGASSEAAQETMIHETTDMGGMAHMHMVAEIAVPAGASLTFAPGGYHVMLMGLSGPLEEGAQIPLTLEFSGAGSIGLDVPILGIGAMGPE